MHDLNGLLTGPLAGSFPLLSLRTNKADVAVGISQETADELDARGEKWRVNGKYVAFVIQRMIGNKLSLVAQVCSREFRTEILRLSGV